MLSIARRVLLTHGSLSSLLQLTMRTFHLQISPSKAWIHFHRPGYQSPSLICHSLPRLNPSAAMMIIERLLESTGASLLRTGIKMSGILSWILKSMYCMSHNPHGFCSRVDDPSQISTGRRRCHTPAGSQP